MGNIVNTVKRFSSNDANAIPVQRCSDLSIGTSKLDKSTSIGKGISVTGETASASKGGSINGCKDFCEVANEGMHTTPGSNSTKGCLGGIDLLTPPMVHTRSSGSDEGNDERETPNGTVHTDATELGCVDHSEKSGLIYSQTAGHIFHNLEDESTETPRSSMLDISKESLCKVSPEGNSFRDPKLADAMESSPAADAHKGKEVILDRVSPADGLFDRNVCEELADGALDSCYKSSAEVSLDGQRHEQSTQHKSVNYDVVPIEVIAACANLDVCNPKSSLKGQAKRKRITKATNQMLPKENSGTLIPSDPTCVETHTNALVERSSGDKVLQGTPRSRKTKSPVSYVHHSPLTRSKSKALSITTPDSVKMKRSKVHHSPLTLSKSKALSIATPESVQIKRSRSGRLIVPQLDPGSQNITYDPPSGPPKKQRSALEKLQGAARSPFTSPVPYVCESPLTRGTATSLSMSTPEALKLRKTRSGRVVVPTLDAGCQRIVYDMDGGITGVIGCHRSGFTIAQRQQAENVCEEE